MAALPQNKRKFGRGNPALTVSWRHLVSIDIEPFLPLNVKPGFLINFLA